MCREKINLLVLSHVKEKKLQKFIFINSVQIDLNFLFCNLWGKLKTLRYKEDITYENMRLKLLYLQMLGLFDD